MTMREKILAHFAEQAMYCDMFGSPFTAQLVKAISADYEQGRPDCVAARQLDHQPARRRARAPPRGLLPPRRAALKA